MYALWGRRIKQLKREVKKCLRGEKENKESELYGDMRDFERDFATPLFEFYNRLSSQEFIRFTDKEKLFKLLYKALHRFKDLVDFYSTPPESNTFVPFSEVQLFHCNV